MNKPLNRHLMAWTATAIALLLIGTTGNVLAQAAPARVVGPIPSASLSSSPDERMLNPSAIELAAHGYIEEEYFIEGIANQYTSPELQTAEIIDGGHRYRSRFIVRRPLSAGEFNGVVVIEWNNVTASRDLDIDWWQSGAHFVRNGYAFISVSAQRVGVAHLKATRPGRYESLDVTHDGMVTNDALSYDIFSAVAKAVPRKDAADPADVDILGGLRADNLIATGHSQSASRLATYLNNIHMLDPVFDGIMVHGGGGRIRDDQPVKIFKIMAETDMAGRAANPQPNSNTFRHWEVAGTSHVDLPFEIEYARMVALEAGQPTEDVAPRSPVCELPTYSHVPFRYAMNAAFEHLREWITTDTLPPRAPPLQIAQVGPPLVFARDEHGNILGGIRLAEHAVPLATNTGMNGGDAFCRLYGSHQAFDAATLKTLYPSRQAYLDAVRAAVEENVAAGFMLEYDGLETLRAAENSQAVNW
jgi:hypothetical protein